MLNGMKMLCAGVFAAGWMVLPMSAGAQSAPQSSGPFAPFAPLSLSTQAEPESIYAPPSPPSETEGVNQGAVHFDLSVGYFSDYVFRGIELFQEPEADDQANLQIDSKLSWDLGKFPHPFIAVFVNYADSDPISSFQEVRPTLGFEWTIRPLILSAGHTTYIYPDRNEFETSEAWAQLKIDDSYFLRTEQPLFSPYIFGAYDYDLYNGWYFEAGVSHDFVIEDTGLTITALANVAYVHGSELYARLPNQRNVDGLQHYDLGLIGTYSLNKLLNFTERYGEWSLQGFVHYTDGIDDQLQSTSQVWGGAAIVFRY